MSTHSSLDLLNQAIQESNPFESNFVAKSHHIWDDNFLDLPSLHAHASSTILEKIEKINSGNLPSRTAGVALLAPKGVGKTHVLSRVRHHLKDSGGGFFIYMCEYSNLSQIKYQFLQSLAFSLKKVGSKGVTQWQELATALINQALEKSFNPRQLVNHFPNLLKENPQIVSKLAERITSKSVDFVDNPYVVRAILWTLSQAHLPFAVNWLAGRELSEAQAKMMDLPDVSKEDRNATAFNTIRQILDIISCYTTPVICFDELDGTDVVDDIDPMLGGYTRAQVVASLVKDIYNNLKRGVLVTAMYTRTWREEFNTITSSEGIKDRIAQQEIEISGLKSDDAVMLVAYWLEKFYSERGLTPPHAVYPFDESQLREFTKNRETVRSILKWCAQNFSPVVIDPVRKLEKIYCQVEASLEDISDDNEKIANALAFGFQHLKGQTVQGVTLRELDREVQPRWKHRGCINFRVLGEEKGQEVKIGVCVSQDSHGKSVGAAIKYLTWYSDFNLTRGCLIRSKSIQASWQVANANLDQLLNKQGGEWISFKDEEIRSLLTLHKMFKELDKELFSDEDFQQFIIEKHPISNNTLIQEILSDPSGQSPEGVVDEDRELERLFSEELANASDANGESDDLDLLSVA